MAGKRIALFAGQADESYQSRFITGFLGSAFKSGYDVCIFSMYLKYQDTPEREQGESNIFSLMSPDRFAAAVILKDSIQTENAAKELELRLKENFDKPVLVIENDSEFFPSIFTESYSSVFALVTHLIRDHKFRDIAFLSGKKHHKHSIERLNAYRDAMTAAGLEVKEDRIIHGDFWYRSGEMCADELLSFGKKLPDAVACANDQMAIGLCKAFSERGIKVPDDIAVVGYDSTYEGRTSPRPITSAMIPAEKFGKYAFTYLLGLINGKNDTEPFVSAPELVIGESCGCKRNICYRTNVPLRDEWGTDISEERYSSIFNTIDEDLLSQNTLEDYLSTVYSYVYQITGAKEFHLCLSGEWKGMGLGVHIRNKGYSQKMLHAIRYYDEDRKKNTVSTEELFDTAEMLPELYEGREKNTAFFFTPLFFEDECFGYASVSYGDALRSYDDTYRRWIGSVSRGLEFLRREINMQQLQEQLDRLKSSKFSVSDRAYENLNPEEKSQYHLVSKILDENLLDYYFQPIVSAVDGSVYAYEALMRSRTESKVPPLNIIKYAAMQDRLSDVERATFLNVLEFIDSHLSAFGDAMVFINSIPGVGLGEARLSELDTPLASHADKVVIELTEEAELKDSELDNLKNYFDKLGINIAVDDYGTGYSNVSNLLRYMPDFVKIDRSLLSDINEYTQKQHFVREIIDFCHDNGIKALAEGVETDEELHTVIKLGADLIQGYYTAKPSASVVRQIDEKCRARIKQFHQERIDGNSKRVHVAGKTNRISLSTLAKDGCTDIIIGSDDMVYKDISIIGTPQMKTDIHLLIQPEYRGTITLEDVYFTNVKNRPGIDIGENASVSLALVGFNTLYRCGIQVPDSSKLVIEGEGSLLIDLDAAESYAIGNDFKSHNGEIVFNQDGLIRVKSRGKSSICIGSGMGGIIRINRGEYNFDVDTESSVCIGSVFGMVDINITTCRIDGEFASSVGTFIGSMENDASISITKSSVSLYDHGETLAAIGTLRGAMAYLKTRFISLTLNVMADASTALGALNGRSDLDISDTHLKVDASGKNALVFGGYSEDSNIVLANSDISVKIRTTLEKETFAREENIKINNSRTRIIVNGQEVEHTVNNDF
ncbi:MAG: EAL domain-containing protein [Oscillospiraceae bacterium]|nr:EAL domain-containing protein [Oscillospiraceae bacterium]